MASLGSSMSPNDAVEDCPVVNITQQTLDTIVFCQSELIINKLKSEKFQLLMTISAEIENFEICRNST